MTPERRKTLILMITTLVIGMLIGALAVALIKKASKPSARTQDDEAIIQKVLGVMDADANQAKLIRPYILETMSNIDSLQKQTDDQMVLFVDSFELKVRPLISEKQMEKLKQFHKRVRKKNK